MTVIAWDGTTLAADKQLSAGGMRMKATKIKRLANGDVAAICGDAFSGYALFDWYERGADLGAMPDFQKTDDFANIIVANKDGCKYLMKQPAWLTVEDSFSAWGSGADFAMGAMAMGADAIRAIEIAGMFSTGCGLGVDAFTIREVT